MPLNVACILGLIFFMLFSDFREQRLRSISTPLMAVLTEFCMHMPTQMSIHYWIHGILVLACYSNIYVLVSMRYLYLYLLAADAVSLGSWFIVFNVLTLNVVMLKVFMLLSKFGLCLHLGSVADFSNVGTKAPTQ